MLIFQVLKYYKLKESALLLYNYFLGKLFPYGFVYTIELAELLRSVPASFQLSLDGDSSKDALLFSFNYNEKKIKLSLRTRSSDFAVFKQVFIHEEYSGLIPYIKELEQNGNRIVLMDVGANVGYTSVYLSSRFNCLDIIAIEPFPSNVKQIFVNSQLNSMSNIKIFEGGLWSSDSMLSFNRDFLDSREWAISLKNDGKGEVNCKSISTLKKDFGLNKVDILKIDIEGGEKELFMSKEFIAELNDTSLIAVEIHEDVVSINEIHNVLINADFAVKHSGETTIARKTTNERQG